MQSPPEAMCILLNSRKSLSVGEPLNYLHLVQLNEVKSR